MSQVDEFESNSAAFERLGELWRAHVPSEVHVAAARARIQRRQLARAKNERRSIRRRAAIFFGGVILGASGLAYAGWAPWQALFGWHEEATTMRDAAASRHDAAAQRSARARPAATSNEGPDRESKANGAVVGAEVHAPASQALEGTARTAANGDWADVARALRAGDEQEARAHLDQLTRNGPRETREAARLARAQLRLSTGQNQEARHDLRELAAHATREHVRDRAQQLLDGMNE